MQLRVKFRRTLTVNIPHLYRHSSIVPPKPIAIMIYYERKKNKICIRQ